MDNKPASGSGRIRPLARRLDSLSGSPTSATARPPSGLVRPKPRVASSIASSPSSLGEETTVKGEDISVRDMLAQARLRESKLEPQSAPSARGRRQVILTDLDMGRKMGLGASAFFTQDHVETKIGVSMAADDTRCCPIKVPFDGENEIGEAEEHILRDGELVLVQLPHLFPTLIPPMAEGSPSHPTGRRRGAKVATVVTPATNPATGTPVSEIPDGRIGTLKVHKSGKVVLQVGSTLLNVNEGQRVNFRTEVACVCPAEGEIIFLGDLSKRLVASPTIS